MERNRLDKIRRHAAARLIQASWKKYCFEKKQALNIYDDDDPNHSLRRVFILGFTGIKDSNQGSSGRRRPRRPGSLSPSFPSV